MKGRFVMQNEETKQENQKKKHKVILGILLVITLILLICGIKAFANVNEYNFSRNITINMSGGSANIGYYTSVDRAGGGHSGDWFDGLGVGETVKDKWYKDHTVNGFEDCESPIDGTFYEHCDFVGVTPYVKISDSGRTYYNFSGWSTNTTYFYSDGYYYFECGCYAADSGNIEITANWSAWEHMVNYDANGGSGGPGNQTKRYGEAMSISEQQPTKSGYVFGGWSCSLGGTYQPGNNYTYDQNGGAVTMKAIWNACEHTVTYDANGGNGAPADQKKKYGEQMFLREGKPTRTGYSFLGWNCSIGGTYQPGAEYTHDQNGGTVIMKAIWKDDLPPFISGLTAEPTVWSSGNGTVSITAIDQGSGISRIVLQRISLVNNTTTTVKTWYHFGMTAAVTDTYTENNEGVFYYVATVTDIVGNSSMKRSATIYLDHSAPVLSGMSNTNTEWTNDSPVISFSATDYLSGTIYSGSGLDSVEIKDDSGNVVARGISSAYYRLVSKYEGIHTWYITATDNVGHINSSSVSTKFDTTAPGLDGTEVTDVINGVSVSGYCQDNIISQHIDDEPSRSVNSPNCTSGLKSIILYKVKGGIKTAITAPATRTTFAVSDTYSNFDMYYEIIQTEDSVDYYMIVVQDYAGNMAIKKLTSQRSLLTWFHTSIDRSTYE